MRFRGRGVLLGAMAAMALVGALVVGNAVAKSQKVVLGDLVIELDGSVSPSKLSKSTPQPITLNLSGKAGTTDGTHVPPLKELFVEFTRKATSTPRACRAAPSGNCRAR